MASRTAADRRPSAPELPSQWSCGTGKLIPIHLRLSGGPARVSKEVPAPFPHALRTREFDAPARERKQATPRSELSAFSSTVAERRRESSGWPQRQPASRRSPEDGRGRTPEGTAGSTPAPRPRHPACVSRAGFLTFTLQGPMGSVDKHAPPRDRPGLLFLTYAVPAFFAWSGCWLGTRGSVSGSSTGVA